MFHHLFLKLIGFAARWVARRVERSPARAAAGFVMGAAAGFWIGWRYGSADAGLYPVVALMILGGIAGAAAGAGSAARAESPTIPVKHRAGFVPLPRAADDPIRVTNYNVAMVPVVIFAISLAFVVLGIYCWSRLRSHSPDEFSYLLIAAAFPAALFAVIAGRRLPRQIVWIEIADQITVGGLLRQRVYEVGQIHAWHLHRHGGVISADSSQIGTEFLLQLKNGVWFRAGVSPSLAERISDELGRAAPVAAVTPCCLT